MTRSPASLPDHGPDVLFSGSVLPVRRQIEAAKSNVSANFFRRRSHHGWRPTAPTARQARAARYPHRAQARQSD